MAPPPRGSFDTQHNIELFAGPSCTPCHGPVAPSPTAWSKSTLRSPRPQPRGCYCGVSNATHGNWFHSTRQDNSALNHSISVTSNQGPGSGPRAPRVGQFGALVPLAKQPMTGKSGQPSWCSSTRLSSSRAVTFRLFRRPRHDQQGQPRRHLRGLQLHVSAPCSPAKQDKTRQDKTRQYKKSRDGVGQRPSRADRHVSPCCCRRPANAFAARAGVVCRCEAELQACEGHTPRSSACQKALGAMDNMGECVRSPPWHAHWHSPACGAEEYSAVAETPPSACRHQSR